MNPTPRNPQVERISAAANPTLKSLRRLAQGSDAYREQGRLWLEGDHLLQAALARGVALQLALVSEQAFYENAALQALALRATRVLVLPAALFGSLSELVTPVGIAGCVAWSRQSIEPGWPTVVLDRLQDAGNVGSILRSAAALGVRQIVALKGTAALGSAKVMRAGMGAHFALRLVEGIESDALAALQVPMLATSSHAPWASGSPTRRRRRASSTRRRCCRACARCRRANGSRPRPRAAASRRGCSTVAGGRRAARTVPSSAPRGYPRCTLCAKFFSTPWHRLNFIYSPLCHLNIFRVLVFIG